MICRCKENGEMWQRMWGEVGKQNIFVLGTMRVDSISWSVRIETWRSTRWWFIIQSVLWCVVITNKWRTCSEVVIMRILRLDRTIRWTSRLAIRTSAIFKYAIHLIRLYMLRGNKSENTSNKWWFDEKYRSS